MAHKRIVASTDTRYLEGVSPEAAEAILANTNPKFRMFTDENCRETTGYLRVAMIENKKLVVNELIWLHGTDSEFTEYRKPSRGFGRLGVMLTLDLDLAEHYGSIVLENTVSVENTLRLGQDDSDVWASISSGDGETVERIKAEYDSVLYERETEAGESFVVLVVFDPASVQITGTHKPEMIRPFTPMRMG